MAMLAVMAGLLALSSWYRTMLQAFGAENVAALPIVFQRCLCFMAVHGMPMLLILVFLPQLLHATGQPAAVYDAVGPYRFGLIAALPLEVINRCTWAMITL